MHLHKTNLVDVLTRVWTWNPTVQEKDTSNQMIPSSAEHSLRHTSQFLLQYVTYLNTSNLNHGWKRGEHQYYRCPGTAPPLLYLIFTRLHFALIYCARCTRECVHYPSGQVEGRETWNALAHYTFNSGLTHSAIARFLKPSATQPTHFYSVTLWTGRRLVGALYDKDVQEVKLELHLYPASRSQLECIQPRIVSRSWWELFKHLGRLCWTWEIKW